MGLVVIDRKAKREIIIFGSETTVCAYSAIDSTYPVSFAESILLLAP